MKTGFLILLCLLLQVNLLGQCKYSVNKKDDFNKSHTLVTTTDRVGVFTLGQPELSMSLGRFDNGSYSSYAVWVNLELLKRNTCFSNNSKLMLIDSEGEVYEMSFSNELRCATRTKTSDTYYISGYFDTSLSELNTLSTKLITKVRIITTDMNYDFEMRTNKDGYGTRWFERMVPCIIK